MDEARSEGHAHAICTQSVLLLDSFQAGTEFVATAQQQEPAVTSLPLVCRPVDAKVWEPELLAKRRFQYECAQRESMAAFVAAYYATARELATHIANAVDEQRLTRQLTAWDHPDIMERAIVKCKTISSPTRSLGFDTNARDQPCVAGSSRAARTGVALVDGSVKSDGSASDCDKVADPVTVRIEAVAHMTIAEALAEADAIRQKRDKDEWQRANLLSSSTEPSCTVDEHEAAIASLIREKASERGIMTELTPSEVDDIFASVGRSPDLPWMTFHRNPYCWHEMLNYLGVDPLARGFLYGLANMNAVGWQEATFVLLKCVDEKTIEESTVQDSLTFYQTSSLHKGTRTASKRVMSYTKNAMAHHSITVDHPMWRLHTATIAGSERVRTAWNQNTTRGSTMNQPQYLADPAIIYRSLAGRRGLVEWPPWHDIPGAGWEPYKGGPRHYAIDLLARLPNKHWAD